MTTKFFSLAKTLILAIVLSIGLSYVHAWTAPTVAPPNGNVTAPINTGSTAQTKAGALNVAQLGVAGDINATGNVVSSGAVRPLRINFFGLGGNSGATPDYYGIYQESGPWNYPYPDLRIQYHTGIKYDAHQSYGGHQFFTGYDASGNPAGRQMQITDKVYVDTDVCTTGGKCLSAASTGGGIGVGQTWQNMSNSSVGCTSARKTGVAGVSVACTNSTGKPIQVMIEVVSGGGQAVNLTIGGLPMRTDCGAWNGNSLAGWCPLSFIVPDGTSYSISLPSGRIDYWYELR